MTRPYEAGLTPDGCRARQLGVHDRVARERLDAALVCDRLCVHYLTGYWCPAVLIKSDGPVTLVAPHPVEAELAADAMLHYPAQRLAALTGNQLGAALDVIAEPLRRRRRVGTDGPVLSWAHPAASWVDLRPALLAMRRAKLPGEVALLRRAISAAEAAHAWAFESLRAGANEVGVFSGIAGGRRRSRGRGTWRVRQRRPDRSAWRPVPPQERRTRRGRGLRPVGYAPLLLLGDVFTAEPGLYSPELRAGLRIEEIYRVYESGIEKLTVFPTDLA
jgi:Xaa-Pro aminopeptidase